MVDNEEMKFAYADMHGNLKILLNEPINLKEAYDFATLKKLNEIISRFQGISGTGQRLQN